jgi:hypothetical protein
MRASSIRCQSSRRRFLRQSAALAAAYWVGSSSLVKAQRSSASEEIRFACVGVGGKGANDSVDIKKEGRIVALCDIDEESLGKAALNYPDAEKFADYRDMFDKIGHRFDAVTISTPDHSHAPAAIRAMRLGKHCFCQKPLSYTVAEARLMRELAAEKKLCTQMGNQGTAYNGFREAVEIIRRGDIGAVHEIHVWTNRPLWPQGVGLPPQEPCPPSVHWDLFLGPAKERPYSKAYHPFNWRGWFDFGTGALGDMACHSMNMAVRALDLFDPISVEPFPADDWQGDARSVSYPKQSTIKYTFGPRGNWGPCTLTWYDGGRRPDELLLLGEEMNSAGSLVIGEKGRIYSPSDYHENFVVLPRENFKDLPKPDFVASPGHHTEFANAIRQNKPELAMANFEYSGRLTETVLLGNVALRAGKKIEWNGPQLLVTNDMDANQYLRREYRQGFEL